MGVTKKITLFPYRCSCGETDHWIISARKVRCPHCDTAYPISRKGVISFNHEKSEQNRYFDTLYRTGYAHAIDRFKRDHAGVFQNSKERTESYLNKCGFDPSKPIENLSILDAACGVGWLAAGLMQNSMIINSRIHAFDISSAGLDQLSSFTKNLKSSSRLELSTQNAERMMFGDATFDVILGSSILHHFDSYDIFLKDCHRIMKPGSVAIFGEPFALGYGIGASSLLLAQDELGISHQEVKNAYDDIAYRVKNPRELLKNRVDKHLFIQSEFLTLAQEIGFRSVDYVSFADREYYRDSFINELLLEIGITDTRLAERANAIYRLFYDIFDNDRFVHSIASFIYIILRS